MPSRAPEFAYSAEKWATLRDNKLEFDEIKDLVHEYNPTVIQNEISYKDYLTKNRDDVAQEYYDKANEIYSNINYPDSDDANYGSGVAAALHNEQQAKNLMERAMKTPMTRPPSAFSMTRPRQDWRSRPRAS